MKERDVLSNTEKALAAADLAINREIAMMAGALGREHATAVSGIFSLMQIADITGTLAAIGGHASVVAGGVLRQASVAADAIVGLMPTPEAGQAVRDDAARLFGIRSKALLEVAPR